MSSSPRGGSGPVAVLDVPRGRRRPALGPPTPAVVRRPRTARVLTAVYAVGTVAALGIWLFAAPVSRPTVAEQVFGLLNVPVARSFLSVVVMVLVTGALVTRRRTGLVAVAAFQVVGIAVGVLALLPRPGSPWLEAWRSRGDFGRLLDVVAMVVGVGALVVLWRARAEFRPPSRTRHLRAAALTAVGGSLATLGVAALLLEASERRGATASGLLRAVLYVLAGVGGGRHGGPGLPGHVAPWITEVVATLAGVVLAASVAVLLRPSGWRPRWDPDDEVAVRALLRGHGGADSLGYLATRRDKGLAFAPDRQAVVGYRVVAGVSLAAADPVGAPAARPAAVRAWLDEAHRNGWVPAVVSASEDGARLYRAAGLRVGSMGDEAVLDRDTWDPTSPARRSVARAARRARRTGVVVTCSRQGRMSPAELAEVGECAGRWRGDEPERGFSMALGRTGDAADRRVLHVLARDAAGRLVGLLAFVPWGASGLSLDLMRHDPAAPNGVTELMVVELMARARELGVARVSLNFCMFRSTFGSAGHVAAPSWVRAGAVLLGWLDAFWQLERLYRFNRRFDPRWVGRYYCVQDPATLPLVALAAASAEGFLPTRRPVPEGVPLDEARLAGVRALDEADVEQAPPVSRQQLDRRRRRAAMLAAGVDPHPPGGGAPPDTVREVVERWREGAPVELSARVRRVRDHGGVAFVDLVDGGVTVQAVLERADRVAELARFVDPGDIVRVAGVLARSRRGVPGIRVERWSMEAKAVRPVPFDGLRSPAARTRDRTADLLVNPAGAQLLRDRSAVVAALRRTLLDEGYLEVETPVLQSVHGGASARPFRTWSNAYAQDLSLRIAPELYLKRLLVGGLGPVFEVARNFRNEGADGTHNPEFTALEVYQPHGDYTSMRALTLRLVAAAAVAVHGRPVVPVPRPDQLRQGLDGVRMVPVDEAWPSIRVTDAVGRALGAELGTDPDRAELGRLAAARGIDVDPALDTGELLEHVYSELVEPVTSTPAFFTDFPRSTSPLARPHRHDPGLAERWDLVVAGMEVATAYSELTDPLEQRERLTRQSVLAAGGDPEAMELDEDFLAALELGMPPAGGLGIGVDRLVMLLTNRSVRSVLAFPFVRPDRRRAADEADEAVAAWA
ncbi:bifunctional lysylphosphatidylglycerol synthetase/lysine--tRNA ligase LysX [Phycicoccus avicenniae]|uniref:bifunctional lysylphosphatidylglycerol synthetase/lysine--tRNA ligase LysX n=1 Tax=Phycicoccus avicenniae TaxID=2828860 RepID=UPI003D2C3D35